MCSEHVITCASCGAEISCDVPEYFIELECFRIISEREEEIPRRGSKQYHEAMDKLSSDVREAYFQNREMYDQGHLWCPVCGGRLGKPQSFGDT